MVRRSSGVPCRRVVPKSEYLRYMGYSVISEVKLTLPSYDHNAKGCVEVLDDVRRNEGMIVDVDIENRVDERG